MSKETLPGKYNFRVRQKIGKYKIEGRLGMGGFAQVYRAMDTIEGIRVAIKIPHESLVTTDVLKDFKNEVRISARLEHPNILPLKDASFIDGRLVLTYPLGNSTLGTRIKKRMAVKTALFYAEQMIEAVAYAHSNRIVHCDIKPENVILFDGDVARLADFGIAKVAHRTLSASGQGTLGHMAPEQAMGKPSQRSDVFSLGLIVWRMLTGEWPQWPYEWPLEGAIRLRGKVHPDMIAFLRRSLEFQPRKRFRDGEQMLDHFLVAKRKTEVLLRKKRRG